MSDCIACAVVTGEAPLPGGLVHATSHWRVEHCFGPLGVGTWIVKPARHVTFMGELTDGEADELGPLLRRVAAMAEELVPCEQVYVELWSHAGDPRGHLHFVVAPVTSEQVERFGRGPFLHAGMFAANEQPDPDAVEAISERARAAMTSSAS